MHIAIIFNNKKSDKQIDPVNQSISFIWNLESVKSISLVSTYFKLWYLNALKINFVPRFFHNLANWLFWVLWVWLNSSTYQSLGQVDVYLHAKIDFIPPFFVEILPKNYKFGVLGTLGMPGYDHQKWWSQFLENLSSSKKSVLPLTSFLKYC